MTSRETLNLQDTEHPVGASLLAKAPCQATHRLNDSPHSRASSLPQGICQVLALACAASRSSAARKPGSVIPSAVA